MTLEKGQAQFSLAQSELKLWGLRLHDAVPMKITHQPTSSPRTPPGFFKLELTWSFFNLGSSSLDPLGLFTVSIKFGMSIWAPGHL